MIVDVILLIYTSDFFCLRHGLKSQHQYWL